mgnify:CR=1 FL=1
MGLAAFDWTIYWFMFPVSIVIATTATARTGAAAGHPGHDRQGKQQQEREQRPFSNRLDPDSLNQLDRRILRESFRQAKRLQGSLALRYNL